MNFNFCSIEQLGKILYSPLTFPFSPLLKLPVNSGEIGGTVQSSLTIHLLTAFRQYYRTARDQTT